MLSVVVVDSMEERCEVCSVLALVKKVATEDLRRLLKLSRMLLDERPPSLCAGGICPKGACAKPLAMETAPPSELGGGEGVGCVLGP